LLPFDRGRITKGAEDEGKEVGFKGLSGRDGRNGIH